MDRKNIKNINDLLSDEAFVRWVKFPDQENSKSWDVWLKHNPDRQHDVSLARELILRMQFKTKYPAEGEIKRAFRETMMSIDHLPKIPARRQSRRSVGLLRQMYYAKIAAVILVVLTSVAAVYWIYQNNKLAEAQRKNTVEIIKRKNPIAVRSKIILPDGSRVWLNAQSELTYPAQFGETREVQLVGEAYFDVAKDLYKPFIVKTKLSDVRVLGTSFNVNTYGENAGEYISLVSGKVAVSLPESDTSSLLLPGEQVVIDKEKGIGSVIPFDSVEVTGWTQGWLTFKNANKDEIINKLSRWYGVNIELLNEPSEQWNVNGYFWNQPLELVLDRLSFSKDFDYEINDKTVKIKFK